MIVLAFWAAQHVSRRAGPWTKQSLSTSLMGDGTWHACHTPDISGKTEDDDGATYGNHEESVRCTPCHVVAHATGGYLIRRLNEIRHEGDGTLPTRAHRYIQFGMGTNTKKRTCHCCWQVVVAAPFDPDVLSVDAATCPCQTSICHSCRPLVFPSRDLLKVIHHFHSSELGLSGRVC